MDWSAGGNINCYSTRLVSLGSGYKELGSSTLLYCCLAGEVCCGGIDGLVSIASKVDGLARRS